MKRFSRRWQPQGPPTAALSMARPVREPHRVRRSLTALFFWSSGVLFVASALLFAWLYFNTASLLNEVKSLKSVENQVPMRVYSQDGRLISEFGDVRRFPVSVDQVPSQLINAFIAVEDESFWSHWGVDFTAILRALVRWAQSGERTQGGSTITMQVARNFYLSREKTIWRKAREILLAIEIERRFSKEEIIELYLNRIYFGNRAYGVRAAAKVYYGRPLESLSLAQMAMIAGLPKAPSTLNPLIKPRRALQRRNHVLRRMHEAGFIDAETRDIETARPVTAKYSLVLSVVDAPHAAEMARLFMIDKYGEEAYDKGYNVYTTIDPFHQRAARESVRSALYSYQRRHFYPGPVLQLSPDILDDPDAFLDDWTQAVSGLPTYKDARLAVVALIEGTDVLVWPDGDSVAVQLLPLDGYRWALEQPSDDPLKVVDRQLKQPNEVLHRGDVIYIHPDTQELIALPEAEGALVSMEPKTGAIKTLVGGFDFHRTQFNRALQAERQPGSAFKPFLYLKALEEGYTAASVVNDAPIVVEDSNLEGKWRPENFNHRFYGPMLFREALVKSRNLVSIRLLEDLGIPETVRSFARFGFDRKQLTHNLSLALGNSSVTPYQLNTAYLPFANGGYRVEPYLIQRVEDRNGQIIYQAPPQVLCDEGDEACAIYKETGQDSLIAPRIIEERTNYILYTILQEVMSRGTARYAGNTLRRRDFAGKTGTTNDFFDAWFTGFNAALVTTVWMGHDNHRSLGPGESGSRAALPIWVNYIQKVIKTLPQTPLEQPPGLVSVAIDPVSGKTASPSQQRRSFELFREENALALQGINGGDGSPGVSADTKVGGKTIQSIGREIF